MFPERLPRYGRKMCANFYKCGEKVEQPHWGAGAEVPRLDFHLPEYFGYLELV